MLPIRADTTVSTCGSVEIAHLEKKEERKMNNWPLRDMCNIGHVSYSMHLAKYAASLTFILQVWCTYTTPEALEQQVMSDDHSPDPFRYRI